MNSRRLRLFPLATLLCLLSGLVAFPSAGFAQATPAAAGTDPEAPQFFIDSISDPDHQWFEITLASAESATLVAGVHNSGSVPATLRAFITNATTAPNGGFQPGVQDDELGIPAQWIQLSTQEFTVDPGQMREVEFSVTVPAGTPPGFYVAAFVVQTTDSFALPGSETFRQIVSNAVSVEITVPGEMASGLQLDEPTVTISGQQWLLDVPITNTGTARVRPAGQLVITTPTGEVVSSTNVEMGSVYGGNTTSVRVMLPGQLPLGDYLVSLDLSDAATGATASISDAPITLAEPEVAAPEIFVVDEASVTPNTAPIQYANVAATITNNGPAIPTANVILVASRNGQTVERYPLTENQALPPGTTEFTDRYIPIDGWNSGTWTFELVITAVSGSTETVLATVAITDDIIVP